MRNITFMISALAVLLSPLPTRSEEVFCQEQWYAHCNQKGCQNIPAGSGDSFTVSIDNKNLKRCMILNGSLSCWQLEISNISVNPYLRQITVANGSALSDEIVVTSIAGKTTFFATLLTKDGSSAASGVCAISQ